MRLLLVLFCFTSVVWGKIFTPMCAVPPEHLCSQYQCCNHSYLNKTAIANRLFCTRGYLMAVDSANVETFPLDSIECSPASTFAYKAGNVEKTAAKVTCAM